MEIKWILAIALEAGFWIMLAAFLVLRYRFGLEGITRLFVIGVVLDTAGILALGVWDFAVSGEVSGYTLFIAALIAYGADLGQEGPQAAGRLDGPQGAPARLGVRQAAGRYQPAVPGPPLKGPVTSLVIQPP